MMVKSRLQTTLSNYVFLKDIMHLQIKQVKTRPKK